MLDNDQRYVDFRRRAHTGQERIKALESDLGIDKEEDAQPLPAGTPPPPPSPTLFDAIRGGAVDVMKQVPAGALNGLNELGNGLLDVADWAENKLAGMGIGPGDLVPEERAHGFGNMVMGDADTLAGRMAGGISQFAIGFLPTSRAMQGVRLARYAPGAVRLVKAAASGVITDFAFFDPHQERLSNLIQEYPLLANPVTGYLAADEGDSEAEGRFKNAMEGLGLGLVMDGFLHSLKAYRGWQTMKAAGAEARGTVVAPPAGGASVVPGLEKATAAGGAPTLGNPPAAAVVEAGSTSPATKGSISESDRALQESIAARQRSGAASAEINSGATIIDDPIQRETDAFFDEAMGAEKPRAAVIPNEGIEKIGTTPDSSVPRGTTQQAQTAQEAAGEAIPGGQAKATPEPEKLSLGAFDVGGAEPVSVTARGEATPSALLDPKAAELPDGRAVNINLNRINAGTDLKAVIGAVAEQYKPQINAARRGAQTEASLAQLAADLNMSPADLQARLPGEAFNAEQLLASRAVLNGSADNLLQKAKIAARAEATDIDKAAFLNALEGHKVIQAQVSGAVAEAGRALRSQNMIVGLPTDAQKLRAIKELVQLNGGRQVDELAKVFSQFADVKDISKVMQKSLTRRMGDAIYEVWVNGLISGARTISVNMIGNSMAMFGKVGERAMAEVLGQVKPGARGGLMNADRVALGESRAMMSGIVNGFMDALRLTKKAIDERAPVDQFTQVDVARVPALTAQNFGLSGPVGKAVDYMGMMARWPGRLQMLTDKFFQAVNYRMELHAFAHRDASYRGLQGQEFEDHVKSILINPPDELHFKSLDEARVNTFTNRQPDVIEQLITIAHDPDTMVGQVGRVVVPFLRTNLNIAEYGIQRMPLLNRLSPQMRADIAAGGARKDLAQAKLAWGSSIMAVTSAMAAQGFITGSGPKDYKAKQALESTGWRANSIKVGDTYYSYNRLDPFGMILGMAADWTELAGEAVNKGMDVDDVLVGAVAATASNISAERLVESMVDFGELVTNFGEAGPKYLSNLASSAVPAWLRQFTREGGDVKRDTSAPEIKLDRARGRYEVDNSYFQEAINKLRASIPGFGDDLPARRNMFGEVITFDPGVGVDIASPIYSNKEVDSPARKEIARMSLAGREFDMPREYIATDKGAIPLTPHQYEKYVELSAGVGLYEAMVRAGSSSAPRYKRKLEDELNYQIKNNWPGVQIDKRYKDLDEWKYGMIQATINSYRKMAGIALGVDPIGQDLSGKYEQLWNAKKENVTGRKSSGSVIPPGGSR